MVYRNYDLVRIRAGSRAAIVDDPSDGWTFDSETMGIVAKCLGNDCYVVRRWAFGDVFPDVVLNATDLDPFRPRKSPIILPKGPDFPKHEGWPGDDPAHQRLLGYLHALDETHAIGGDRRAVYAVCNFLEHLGHKEVADKFRVFFP